MTKNVYKIYDSCNKSFYTLIIMLPTLIDFLSSKMKLKLGSVF